MILKTLVILNLYCVNGCKHPDPPPWYGKIFSGDSSQEAIVRAQSNEKIYCNDSNFNNYMCVTYEDFKDLIKIIDSCAVWERDAREYSKKLKACGILTNKNIQMVQECLNEKDSDF